jgi:asparagine synthase (glutamine-hydrolysing)
MCGIYGSTIQYSDEVVKAKLNIIRFRGPDFSSFDRNDDIILGHNRLAILDLDARSNQPFTYLHLKVVFNGEIYNYLKIKTELQKRGYLFTTTSDTEVICAAYLEYGNQCIAQFNGMFSFVIYDSKLKKLFGARDRFGKKPFYYHYDRKNFEFASQPSQLSIGKDFTVNLGAVSEYLIWGYIPEPRSIYSQVQKLPAAHILSFDLTSKELKIEKYWDIDFSWKRKFTGTYPEAQRDLKQLLTDSVKIRMISDVPLGVFLSGGVDSSLIAAVASEHASHIKTFSIKFNEKGFDESTYSRQVADHIKSDHHIIECNYDEGIDLIRNFANFYDEPFADSSAIPSMLLAKYTKQHVTVALSGDGGDEGFVGYGRYKWMKNSSLLFNVPWWVRRALAFFLQLSPNYRHKLIAMGISIKDIETLYLKMIGGMENSWVLTPDLAVENDFSPILYNKSKPLVERLADFDIKTYLNEDINTKVDRASMAFSLESRAPLMDYRIIEFARSLPTEFKYGSGHNQKRILKDILYDYVPKHIFQRPKAGFAIPLEKWFRHDLKDYVLDNLSTNELQTIPCINVKRTEQIINEHMSGRWNRSTQIWKLLVLKQWMNRQKEMAISKNWNFSVGDKV